MEWESDEDVFKDLDETTEIVEDVVEEVQQQEEVKVQETISFEDLDEETTEVTTEQVEEKVESSNILASTAKYQAEKYDIDISGVEEWDEETYAAFVDKVDEIRLEQKYGALKTSNPFAEAILSVLEAEGDTSDLIDLFKEQREFVEIDTTTPEGKLEKIRKFYKDIDNKPAAWIEKHIRRISLGDDTSDIDEEFNLVSEQYDEYFAEETQRKVEEAQVIKQKKEELLNRQINSLKTTLTEQKFSKKETQEMVDFVYRNKYSVRGSDQLLSEFDVAIAKTKNNPQALSELSSYLKDPEKFKQKLAIKVNNVKEEVKFAKVLNKQPSNNKSTKFEFNKS